jgi:tetratricopeptide (TPR) repeat protein
VNPSLNEDYYDELVASIEASQGIFSLLIAVCDDQGLRERLIQRYEQELKADGWQGYRLRLAQREPSLRAALSAWQQHHAGQGNQLVFFSVVGVEDLLWLTPPSPATDASSELDKFLGYLQWTREAVGKFPYPIVLWVTTRVVKAINQRAPDFWSWRRGVFRFESAEVPKPYVPQGLPPVEKAHMPPTGDVPLAVDDLTEMLETTQKQQPHSPILATLHARLAQAYVRRLSFGDSKQLQADRKAAFEHFYQALELQEKYGLTEARVDTLNHLAWFYYFIDQSRSALDIYQQALQLTRQINYPDGEANTLNAIGDVLQFLDRRTDALDHYERAIDLYREVGDRLGEANTLNAMANNYRALENIEKTLELNQASKVIHEAIGNIQGEANCLGNLAIAVSHLVRYRLEATRLSSYGF